MRMIDNDQYPNRGFAIETPSIAETEITGRYVTVRFTRLAHQYDIRFSKGSTACLRDGKAIPWHKLNAKAQAVAHKAIAFINAADKLRN